MLISEAFEMYRTDFIAMRGLSIKTEEAYIATSKSLISRFGDTDICLLTFADVRDWKVWLDKGRQPNTVRNYVVCFRVLLKYLALYDYKVLNYEQIPVPKRINTQVKYLTEDEMTLFIQEAAKPRRGYPKINRQRNIAILYVLYATGLRNSELCSLDRDSIKNNTFTVIGKGSKPRIGFVSDEAMRYINLYLLLRTDTSNALFVANQTGGRLRPGNLRNIFTRICESSTFKGVHPHTIRHSFATKMLNHRVDIRYVQEFMGHTDLNTTAHYTHLVAPDLKEIYDKAQRVLT